MAKRVEVLESHLSSFHTLKSQHYNEMKKTALQMAARGKGLLAADESDKEHPIRNHSFGIENTAENRRRYRCVVFSAPGISQYISGVILHEETLTQKNDSGVPFPEALARAGMVPGIKTDRFLSEIVNGAPGENRTDGLDGYEKRLKEYYALGARFVKWRNVYKIQSGNVSEFLIHYNARTLAQYAVLSQACGLVPIVEPEVMIDGTHTIEQCQAISERVWAQVVTELHNHGFIWECGLLKPNMVVPGAESKQTATPQQIAVATVTALSRTIPAAMPGVMFLSGGLSEVQSSEYLNAMNSPSLGLQRPWSLSFSYGRALQSTALKIWAGKDENAAASQKAFIHRCKMNSLAQLGKYNRAEDDKTSQSLYVKDHKY